MSYATVELPVMALDPGATLPTRGREKDAALDLRSNEVVTIAPGATRAIVTGLAVAVPVGFVGLICGRSGLALESIDIFGGVIDPEYRGEVKVILHNAGPEPFEVRRGFRVGQMLLLPIAVAVPAFVDALDATDRGAAGFGSSGV